MNAKSHATRVVWTLSICTALALLGDTTTYAVLPSHYPMLGLLSLQVGWLLSINRLVRLPLNMASGWLSDHCGAKKPYLAGLALGTFSTVGYGLFTDFWPLLIFRALWGVAWALLAVAAYKMILDVTVERTRGQLMGLYALASLLGSLGSVFGAFLVDALSFSPAMLILGLITSLGFLGALTLPATHSAAPQPEKAKSRTLFGLGATPQAPWKTLPRFDRRTLTISALNLSHRFFFSGVFYATLGLYLRSLLGDQIHLGPSAIGVASLTALLLFTLSILSVVTGAGAGYLSDRLGDRSPVLLLGEVSGVTGLILLALSRSSLPIGAGILFGATAYGIVPPMVMSWMGDLSETERHGRTVGIYQTMGDLGSGIGPLVAYALVQAVGIQWVYAASAGLLCFTIPLILRVRRWD